MNELPLINWPLLIFPSKRCSSSPTPKPFTRLLPLDLRASDVRCFDPSYHCSLCFRIFEPNDRCYPLRRNSHPLPYRIRVLHHRLFPQKESTKDEEGFGVGTEGRYCGCCSWLVRVRDQRRWLNGGYSQNLDGIRTLWENVFIMNELFRTQWIRRNASLPCSVKQIQHLMYVLADCKLKQCGWCRPLS